MRDVIITLQSVPGAPSHGATGQHRPMLAVKPLSTCFGESCLQYPSRFRWFAGTSFSLTGMNVTSALSALVAGQTFPATVLGTVDTAGKELYITIHTYVYMVIVIYIVIYI